MTLRGVNLRLHHGEMLGIAGLVGSGREEIAGALPARRRGSRARCSSTSARCSRRRAIRSGRGWRTCRPIARGRRSTRRIGSTSTSSCRDSAPSRAGCGSTDGRCAPTPRRGSSASTCNRRCSIGGWRSSAAATSRRRCSPAGCAPTRSCCCSTNRPRESTSGPRRRSTPDRRGRREGVGVLIASSDADELVHLCDRVLVMRSGTVGIELEGSSLTDGARGRRDARGHLAPQAGQDAS